MLVTALIEIPEGSSYKYEIDKNTNELFLDRTLKVNLPANYGYVPNTLCEDGDPLDIFVMSKNPLVPKSKMKVELVGIFKCIDNGVKDDKLLGILVGEGLSVLERALQIEKIQYYLNVYKLNFKVLKLEGTFEAITEYQLKQLVPIPK